MIVVMKVFLLRIKRDYLYTVNVSRVLCDKNYRKLRVFNRVIIL